MGQRSIILAVALIIFTVILFVLFIVSRMNGNNTPKKNQEEVAQETSTRNVVAVADIIREPEVYEGYALEVDSDISSWATNRSFFFTATIGGGFGGGTRRSLFVIAPKPFQLPQESSDDQLGLGERANVTAKGTVQIMNKDQLEAALGIDLENPQQTLYDNSIKKWGLGPVLVLTELKVNPSAK